MAATKKSKNNYTFGRGEIRFGRFDPDTGEVRNERYIGNTPELAMTIETEQLDHFDSDHGVGELDASVTTQTTRSGSMSTDNVDRENLAMFFFGEANVLTVLQSTKSGQEIGESLKDRSYQLGSSPTRPSGARNIVYPGAAGTAFKLYAVGDSANPFVYGTDYTLDPALGMVYIPSTSTIEDGTELAADFTEAAHQREIVISGANAQEGSLRMTAFNPEGNQYDIFMPYVRITPNGDFSTKGDDWQVLPFTLSILKKEGYEAVYIDGRAMTA